MRLHTQSPRRTSTVRNLVNLIQAHGIEAHSRRGHIRAQSISAQDGIVSREWVSLDADYNTVQAWLGY